MTFVAVHLNIVRKNILKSKLGKFITDKIESRLGVAVEHLVGAGELLIVLLVFCGLGASFLTNVVGLIYPAYCSLRAIESDGKDDDTEWLIYWVVYAFFSLLEYIIDYVIFWIPFFFPLKLCFLYWCFAPEYKGANVIYVALMPMFRHNQSNQYRSETDIALESNTNRRGSGPTNQMNNKTTLK